MKTIQTSENYTLHTVSSAARYLRLSESSIRVMVKNGHLAAIPVGGYSYVITTESLDQWKNGIHKKGPPLRVTELESWCTSCQNFKLKHEFHRNHLRSSGLSNQCKTCVRKARRKRNGTQPDKFRIKD